MQINNFRFQKKSKWLLLLVWIALSAFQVVAQRYSVTGTVVDTTDVPLPSATVVALQQADSVMVSFGTTNKEGYFKVSRLRAGDYLLQVTFVGHAPVSKPFTVVDKDVDVGKIVLKESRATLEELTIDAEHIPMLIKADTLEYNAAAFKVRPNASVEDLLKKLPGIEVENDGTVKAQGEEVSKVLVDGKEFFGNDPKIATKNLPADAVNKVKVYDKKSEQTEFTGVDDGTREKTINLELKEDSKNGYFGNLGGGYGTEDRYHSKISVNRFSPKMQLSFLGNLNNINEQGFSFNEYMSFMGGMQSFSFTGGRNGTFGAGGIPIANGMSNGFVTTSAGGLNFNYDISDKTDLRSSYFLNRIKNEQNQTTFQEQFLENGGSFETNAESDQISRNLAHRVNLNLRHNFAKNHDIQLRSNLGFGDATLFSNSFQERLNTSDILENSGDTGYNSEGDNSDWDARLIYRKRLGGKEGRSLVAEASTSKGDNFTLADLMTLNSFYNNGAIERIDEINQLQNNNNNNLNFSGELSYTEPIGKNKYLEFTYERQQTYDDQEKEVFDIVNGNDILNNQLSTHYKRDYIYDRGGTNLSFNGDKYSLTIGTEVQSSRMKGDIINLNTEIDKNYLNVLPRMNARYAIGQGKTLNIRYNTSVREPSLTQLQPFTDNQDPLNIYVGNPDLRPSYRHSIGTHFMSFDQFTFTNLFAFLNFSYNKNTIVNSRTITDQFVQITTPVNVDNDWSAFGNVNFGTPIRALHMKINISNNTAYNRSSSIVNEVLGRSDIFSNTVDFKLENRDKDIVDVSVGTRLTYNDRKYALTPNQNQSYFDQAYYANLNVTIANSWNFDTSMDYQRYSKEAFGTAQDVPIWKASLSKYLLNNKAQFQIEAFDLLNKNIGINRTNGADYLIDQRTSSLGRFVLFRFIYSLSGFNKEKGGGGGVHIMRMG